MSDEVARGRVGGPMNSQNHSMQQGPALSLVGTLPRMQVLSAAMPNGTTQLVPQPLYVGDDVAHIATQVLLNMVQNPDLTGNFTVQELSIQAVAASEALVAELKGKNHMFSAGNLYTLTNPEEQH